MTGKTTPQHLSIEDIKTAVQQSGFPLEIKLRKQFHDAGFDTNSYRFQLPGGAGSAEVDLLAGYSTELVNKRGFVNVRAFIEAKNWDPRCVFVGFKWNQPDARSMRAMRARFSGLPSRQVIRKSTMEEAFSKLLLDSPTLGSVLDPLNDAPLCYQWTNVRPVRDGHGKKLPRIEALKEPNAGKSFDKLAQVTAWVEEQIAQGYLREKTDSLVLHLNLYIPTIVLGTAELYTYDAVSEELVRVPRLILHVSHEGHGRIHTRYVDVVTVDAIADLIDTYRKVGNSIRRRFARHLTAVGMIAAAQRKRREEDDFEAAANRLG